MKCIILDYPNILPLMAINLGDFVCSNYEFKNIKVPLQARHAKFQKDKHRKFFEGRRNQLKFSQVNSKTHLAKEKYEVSAIFNHRVLLLKCTFFRKFVNF